MKRAIILMVSVSVFFTFFLTSCSSSRSSIDVQQAKIAEFKRDEYVLLDQVTTQTQSHRVWLLFIPIGGKSEQRLYDNAYQKAVKMLPSADGLIKPRYEYKKMTIPLILVGYTNKKVTITGKGYRLKTEEEMKKNKSNQ